MPSVLAQPVSSAGVLLLGACVAIAFALGALMPATSPALWAVAAGIALGVLPGGAERAEAAGVPALAKAALRAGVALLGLRLSLGALGGAGVAGLAIAVATAALTLAGTVVAGRGWRVHRDLALLVGTGNAICGASAVAAMDHVTRARREHVAYATAVVTVLGTVAMVALPPAARALGLSDSQAATWAGASIQEVAQVAGAGALIGAEAVALATVVKLARVALLAPAVALVGALRRRRAASHAPSAAAPHAGHPPLLPGFLIVFLVLAVARSAGAVPAALLGPASTAAGALLAAGLAGAALQARPTALRAAGVRPLLLGVLAWALATGVSLPLVMWLG
jgi:uncharacterized integral membrane protein (TIGR00698 family)